MKNQVGIKKIHETVYEIAEELIKLGIDRTAALSIAAIKCVGTITSTGIEETTGLYQPEVSIGMRSLRERGWVTEDIKQITKKGRPTKIYSFKVSFDEVLADIAQDKFIQSTIVSDKITKLRKLANEADKKNTKIWGS